MNRQLVNYGLQIFICMANLWSVGARAAPDENESARIVRLIDHVALQTDIRFIRNGEVFEAPEAASHLRAKMNSAGWRIKTAEHFVDYLASRSSMSGTPYEIRLADGRLMLARDWLRAELKKVDHKPVLGKP